MAREWLHEATAQAGLDSSNARDLEGVSTPEAWGLVARAAGISPQRLAELVAVRFGLGLADVARYDVRTLKLVPEKFARRYDVFPLREENGQLVVATCDPTDLGTEQSLAFAAGLPPRFEVAPPETIRDAIKVAYVNGSNGSASSSNRMVETLLHSVDAERAEAVQILAEIQPRPEEAVHVRDLDDAPVVKLANLVLLEAVTRRASDIHIGPGAGGGVVRFRIDGVLQDYMTMPLQAMSRVVSRIKIIGDLDITDRLRPQDGRTRIQVNDKAYDLRISTVPTRDAEKAVVRILDPTASLRLTDIDLPGPEQDRFRELLSYRNGIVIVTGPTGSGKTTTLYAGIRELATGDVNIMTVEDPVEYELPGVTQIQVEPARDVTFASALRAILRQDPDVIFVGEIRDLETAQVAVQASTTGHLVLATLHTNSAVGIISRLAELGLDMFSIESSLRGALAQRLVRKVCRHCAKSISEGDLTDEERFLSERYSCAPTVRAVGCEMCLGTGYHGRVPVAEVFLMDYRLSDLVARGAPAAELERAATKGGMRTMIHSALDRVRAGETTLQEIARVLGQSAEEALDARAAAEAADEAAASAAPAAGPTPTVDNGRPVRRVSRLDDGDALDDEPAAARVPLVAPTPAPAPPVPVPAAFAPPVPRPAEPGGPPHVLVVDDDPQTRRFVRALLEHHAFQVTEVKNGSLALEVLRADPTPYSMVLLDLHMPQLGGQEVLQVLRSTRETALLPVVVLTAANGTSEIDALQGGADDYVQKPIVPDKLLARIHATLRRRGARGAGTP